MAGFIAATMRRLKTIYFIVVTVLSLHELGFVSSASTCLGDGQSELCPIVPSVDTDYVDQPKPGCFAESGTSARLTCKPLHEPHDVELDDDVGRHFVYPDNMPKCRANGTWSSPTAICVDKLANRNSEKVEIRPVKSTNKLMIGPYYTEVGKMHRMCRKNVTDVTNPQTFIKSFAFDGHHYFSYLTVRAPPGKRVITMTVYVDGKAVLMDMSQEAEDYLKVHFDSNFKPLVVDENGNTICAVVELAIFTDYLELEFTLDNKASSNNAGDTDFGDSLSSPEFKFFRILRRADHVFSETLCPDPPVIPHAIKEQMGHDTYCYACYNGYELVVASDGSSPLNCLVTCRNGVWLPLLACRKTTPPPTQVQPSEKSGERDWKIAEAFAIVMTIFIIIFIGLAVGICVFFCRKVFKKGYGPVDNGGANNNN